MDAAATLNALTGLGRTLEGRGLAYEVVAVGGGALLLLGLITRPTADLDLVAFLEGGHYVKASILPEPLARAAREVAQVEGLSPEWLNTGPSDLLDLGLPAGFAERVESMRFGSLVVHLASRIDQIALKVYAATDQGPRSKHFQDLQLLRPTRDELVGAARWAVSHDPSARFREQLDLLLSAFGVGDAKP